jgi:hypothetical protein
MAHAEAADLAPLPLRLALGGELSFFRQSEVASIVQLVALRLATQYALDERWAIAGDFGLATIDSSPERGASEVALRPGNPTLLGLLRGELGGVHYKLGLGGSIPLATIDRNGEGRLQHAAYNIAQGLHAWWDVWIWAPSRAAAIAFGQASLQLTPWLSGEFEMAPALLIPARDAFEAGESVYVFVPTALSLAVHEGYLTPGLRLQAVFTDSGSDALQLAIEPWLRIELDSGFVELRYTASVGEPLAGTRGPGAWGLHLGGGVNL